MVNLPDTTITGNQDSFFIVIKIIEKEFLIRPDEERIGPRKMPILSIVTPSSYLSNITKPTRLPSVNIMTATRLYQSAISR